MYTAFSFSSNVVRTEITHHCNHEMLRRLLLQSATCYRRLPNACYFAPQLSAPVSPAPSPSITRFFSSSSSSQIPNSSFVEHVGDDADQTTSPPTAAISVDRSGLYNPPGKCFCKSSASSMRRHSLLFFLRFCSLFK